MTCALTAHACRYSVLAKISFLSRRGHIQAKDFERESRKVLAKRKDEDWDIDALCLILYQKHHHK